MKPEQMSNKEILALLDVYDTIFNIQTFKIKLILIESYNNKEQQNKIIKELKDTIYFLEKENQILKNLSIND